MDHHLSFPGMDIYSHFTWNILVIHPEPSWTTKGRKTMLHLPRSGRPCSPLRCSSQKITLSAIQLHTRSEGASLRDITQHHVLSAIQLNHVLGERTDFRKTHPQVRAPKKKTSASAPISSAAVATERNFSFTCCVDPAPIGTTRCSRDGSKTPPRCQ